VTIISANGPGYYLEGKERTRELSSFVPLAGQLGKAGLKNSEGLQAKFDTPMLVRTDSEGNIFVADSGNSVIRKISPSGSVTTAANGAGCWLTSFTIDKAGNFLVPCSRHQNGVINQITPAGVSTIFAKGSVPSILSLSVSLS